jgi:hypothetical protein
MKGLSGNAATRSNRGAGGSGFAQGGGVADGKPASRHAAADGDVSIPSVVLPLWLLSLGLSALAGWSPATRLQQRHVDLVLMGMQMLLVGGLHSAGPALSTVLQAFGRGAHGNI